MIFMKLEFRPYLRTMDLNKDDWRIKINICYILSSCMESMDNITSILVLMQTH